MERILVKVMKDNKVIDVKTIEAAVKKYSQKVNLYGLESELCKGVHMGGYSFIKIYTEEDIEKALNELLEKIEI